MRPDFARLRTTELWLELSQPLSALYQSDKMTNVESNWYLTDQYEPEFRRRGTETIRVESEGHLLELLNSFSQQERQLLLLESPQGTRVWIAIGPSLGGVDIYWDTNNEDRLTAKPREVYSARDVWFVVEGQPGRGEANTLMPIDQVISVIAYFYRTHQLAD
jgi:hypothetical protein